MQDLVAELKAQGYAIVRAISSSVTTRLYASE